MKNINVGQEYRKNPLSFVEGGCTIRLVFGKTSLSYDKVKYPKNYIDVAVNRHYETLTAVYQDEVLIWQKNNI